MTGSMARTAELTHTAADPRRPGGTEDQRPRAAPGEPRIIAGSGPPSACSDSGVTEAAVRRVRVACAGA